MVLVMMQEGESGSNPLPVTEWSEEMYEAYENLRRAAEHIERAGLYE